jgi:hypothetical protein
VVAAVEAADPQRASGRAGDRGRTMLVMLEVLPQLVANNGRRALRAAITDPERYAIEPRNDGVRGLIVFRPDGVIETRNLSTRRRSDGSRFVAQRSGCRMPS